MYHNFKSSLSKGQAGEELLLTLWPGLIKLDGRRSDFKTSEGETVELKTDSYTVEKTANFFIELMSDIMKLKVGGPGQALKNGTTYFAYMYPASRVLYVFETTKLVKAMERLLISEQLVPCLIRNKSWVTLGVKVPRTLLKDIYTERKF